MLIQGTFELNDQEFSELRLNGVNVKAFSGMGRYRNKKLFQCIKNLGPIPLGKYYIVDRSCFNSTTCKIKTTLANHRIIRQLTGLSNYSEWFALYAEDNFIDDSVQCDSMIRGAFRLHPKGERGISEGCITIDSYNDFQKVRNLIKATKKRQIQGTSIMTYGTITVK
ncbi:MULTISPECIES: DUF2778 domain-containing protein [Oligella]|uniref:Tlde1 domain-containing protein n=1 Tax=Oligella urethralis DNF00040 TaxID=1401065 RepID=A0A095Z5S9_9BURK|nr:MULTISPECIES: DUF2778 domain-containing protein [Oligella]KGF30090.1 hypothetical protein HMPREF2130_07820 [Oligella urethralis DNF00040]OFS81946.1 hypothetical protein HMPREF3144_11235 [Oligella sp. HMSC05A10]OFV48786.1 hypothetical protein HMPREF3179_05475 [Oligella sp. HMSC09E12]PMC17010.1 DUF2778 domain-containing protein [Oligella urethralis]WOS38739.1 hypothetical protein RP300_02320 [Oligella urethralis]